MRSEQFNCKEVYKAHLKTTSDFVDDITCFVVHFLELLQRTTVAHVLNSTQAS